MNHKLIEATDRLKWISGRIDYKSLIIITLTHYSYRANLTIQNLESERLGRKVSILADFDCLFIPLDSKQCSNQINARTQLSRVHIKHNRLLLLFIYKVNFFYCIIVFAAGFSVLFCCCCCDFSVSHIHLKCVVC